jgi:hypothetical protein
LQRKIGKKGEKNAKIAERDREKTAERLMTFAVITFVELDRKKISKMEKESKKKCYKNGYNRN